MNINKDENVNIIKYSNPNKLKKIKSAYMKNIINVLTFYKW